MNNHTVNYAYPPNFAKAKNHRLANRIFKGNVQVNSSECECCGKRIGQQQVETTCNIEVNQLSFLGPGVPLFFLFLKYIVLLLLLMSVLFMGFAIISNATSNDCGTISSCIPDAFNTISLINKKSNRNFLEIQSYLGLAFVLICIFFFHFFRFQARKLQRECDEVINSPSDYAIILRRLPADITEEDIEEVIKLRRASLTVEQSANTLDLQVVRVILSYSLHEYNQAVEKNIQNFKTCIKEGRIQEFKEQELPKPGQSSHIAIVVFESQAAKDFLIHKPSTYQKFLQFFCTPCIPLSPLEVKGQMIGIERAPQPDDIFWQNSGITMNGAICRKVVTGVISVMILLVGGGAQYGLSLISTTTTNESMKTVLSTISSLIVTIFNVVLMIALSILTKKERNQTLTEFQTVLMVKITMFQFLNAGIFVILSEIAANFQSFSLTNGICSQITMIMILNAIVPNLTLFFLDYSEIINRVLRYCVSKQWLIYTQKELNQIFLGSTIEIPNKYAYILKTLWLTALYAPLIPIVIGVSMLGLLFFYFVEKVLYTKSYSMPNTVSTMSYECAIELLQYFLITFSLGELIIYYYFYNFQYSSIPLTWTITILITICLSILNSSLPMEAINASLFTIEDSSHSELRYTELQSKFQVTYEMTNPAYESKRQRKNIKDFIGSVNQQDSKSVAIELTNLFNDNVNKNSESIRSQKPLLSDFIQNKPMEKSASAYQNNQPQYISISHSNRVNAATPTAKERADPKESAIAQISRVGREQSSILKVQVDKSNQKVQKKAHSVQFKLPEDANNVKIASLSSLPPKEQTEPDKRADEPAPKKEREDRLLNTHKRKSITSKQQVLQAQPEVVDPFGDLNKYTPPKFVLKWRKEQEELQRQQKEKEKEKQKDVSKKPTHLHRQQSILSKLPEQSGSKILLPTPTHNNNLQNTLEKIYANITKPITPAKQNNTAETKPNAIFIESAPISSKYHLSNGKLNIYEEYLDPNKPILNHFKAKKEMAKREKKKSQKQDPAHEHSKEKKFKYLIVNEVSSKPVKKKQSKPEESLSEGQDNTMLLLYKEAMKNNNQKQMNKLQIQNNNETLNENFVDALGKSSHINSRSSLGAELNPNPTEPPLKSKKSQVQFKDEIKQKKATYNPMSIQGTYKGYFNNKSQSDNQQAFKGFLNKKLVMNYLGTPFLNLSKKEATPKSSQQL